MSVVLETTIYIQSEDSVRLRGHTYIKRRKLHVVERDQFVFARRAAAQIVNNVKRNLTLSK